MTRIYINIMELPIIVFKGKKYYRGSYFGSSILGYKDGRDAIHKNVDAMHIITVNDVKTQDIELHKEMSKTNKAYRMLKGHTKLIDENGLKSLIIKSRLPNSIEIAKQYNIDVTNHKVAFKEQSVIASIQKVFKNDKIELQKTCGNYRIDLYFPDYKLALEVDEMNHRERDQFEEEQRQKYIETALGCQFIRCDPDDKNFDVLDVIGDIYRFISKK